MSKINFIFKALGISTIILSSCISPIAAQTTIENLEQLEPSTDFLERPSTPEEVTIDINQPITLQQAVELSLRNNKDLQQAQLTLQRRQRELQEARAALFPTLDLGVDFTNSQTAASDRTAEQTAQEGNTFLTPEQLDRRGQGNDLTQLSGNINLRYNIYTGGERGAEIRRAKKRVEFSELEVERVTENILLETIENYYDLQNADAEVEIEQAAVEDASQTLRDAQLLEQAGLGTRFDVLRAEVDLADAQQRLTSAIAEQSTAIRQLVDTLSLGQQVELATADEIAKAGVWELSLEESIILGYDNRVELEQFLVNREIRRQEKQRELSTIRPQLSIFATYDVLDQFDDDIDWTDGYRLGASLRWTIFDGGRAVALARQSDKDIEIEEVNFANQRNEIRVQVEQAFFNLEANLENISTTEKAVELAEESLRLARLRFQAGVGTQTDVIEAQSDLTTARGNRLRAIIDYNQSLNQLQRAVNGLADGKVLSQTDNENEN
ncbi:MAG: TolC family protein [Xenococcaceae cyanobacterium MO_167.B27]|nr:TolC family protein [Xenococcaceae cyanobacterium MO_167.B27]